MTSYTLGLGQGGLMEDPGFHVENIITVTASTLREAKDKYAKQAGLIDEYWDPKEQTYWGWEIVDADEGWY